MGKKRQGKNGRLTIKAYDPHLKDKGRARAWEDKRKFPKGAAFYNQAPTFHDPDMVRADGSEMTSAERAALAAKVRAEKKKKKNLDVGERPALMGSNPRKGKKRPTVVDPSAPKQRKKKPKLEKFDFETRQRQLVTAPEVPKIQTRMKQGETFKKFYTRMKEERDGLIEKTDTTVKKTSTKKKIFGKQRKKLKIQQQKEERDEQEADPLRREEDYFRTETVAFGDFVDRPPELKFQPKQKLLLKAKGSNIKNIMSLTPEQKALAERNTMAQMRLLDQQRQQAMQAYKEAKKKRAAAPASAGGWK